MEKERKGLFYRLLDFWKEKGGREAGDSIGFWHEKEVTEHPFGEMGAVAVLSREETKRTFWEEGAALAEEAAERETSAQKERIFFLPRAEEKAGKSGTEGEPVDTEKKRPGTGLFGAEGFRKGEQEAEEGGLGRAFFREAPEEEKRSRKIIPVTEETAEEKQAAREETEGPQREKTALFGEKQPEGGIDIERLMRQMTKRLWEEREGCGRRLR